MSYHDIIHRLEDLRELIHRRGDHLTHVQRRHLLHRMELLAERLSYDQSGYDHGQGTPVIPPRHAHQGPPRLVTPAD